ncbi:MAG: calcium/sodium antiporter [Saprospiraceae bacterium]|nr:calcium/sodium antiporter [Saprospiraceae bacterium]MDZ4704321.1 calcium/sodium antiporter [Saprospiraceae bacterium]
MLISLLLFALGLVIVSFSASKMVDGASSLAKRMNIPDIVIGLTIVALGTSAPEMVISILSAIDGKGDLAVGNIVGSNIANILVILGISATIYPLTLQSNTIWKEIPLSLLAAIMVFVMAGDVLIDGGTQNQLQRSDGIVLLGFFVIYLFYTFSIAKKNKNSNEGQYKNYPVWLSNLMIVAGIIGLTLGGKIMVDNAVAIAKTLGISDSVIALTLVAVGTSIPELATSIAAALKRNADIAIGNIIGSNIFNVFLILGVSATISPLYPTGLTTVDFGVCIGASLLLFISCFVLRPMTIYRVEGWTMLLLYVGYAAWLIGKA